MSKILFVEDDQFLSSLLKSRLQKDGFDVFLARDGEEAMAYLKTNAPDLILLDIILPKKSGFELMEEMRSNPQLREAPIIIVSNLGQPEDVTKGKGLGAVEYFVKAKTSIDDLVGEIKEFLKK